MRNTSTIKSNKTYSETMLVKFRPWPYQCVSHQKHAVTTDIFVQSIDVVLLRVVVAFASGNEVQTEIHTNLSLKKLELDGRVIFVSSKREREKSSMRCYTWYE
jgi:hypothetical protein